MRTGYVLDQRGAEQAERERLALVECFHDAQTFPSLEKLGAMTGWRCLDVGAGAGSVARWLTERVGPSGGVVAADLDTRLLEPLARPGLEVRRADIMAGPPADSAFDLVHARLLLIHLPERAKAMSHMVAAARPGGWVMAGDIDFTTVEALGPGPGWHSVWESFLLAVDHAGWELSCGRRLASMLGAAGLQDVRAEGVGGCFRGGDLPGELLARTFERLRERLLAMDVSAADLEASTAELRSPSHRFVAPIVWTAWGQRPANRERAPA
jgi:SAM-dependent methyltransferase